MHGILFIAIRVSCLLGNSWESAEHGLLLFNLSLLRVSIIIAIIIIIIINNNNNNIIIIIIIKIQTIV